MKPACLPIICAGLLVSGLAGAAEYTDVIDSARSGDPFDARLEVTYQETYRTAVLVRERNDTREGMKPEGIQIHQPEFDWQERKRELLIGGRIGLYHDLELHFTLPVVLSHDQNGWQELYWRDRYWAAPPGRDPSLLGHSETRRDAGGNPYAVTTDQVLGHHSFSSGHSGFGDMGLGVAWGPLNQARRPTWPSLVLGLDLTLPTGKLNDPQAGGSGLGVGDKTVDITFSAKAGYRYGLADAYLGLFYTLPIATDSALAGSPQHEGGFLVGSEFVAFEVVRPGEPDEARHRIAFDFRAFVTMHSRGQGYPELVDEMAWRRADIAAWDKDFFPSGPPEYTLPYVERYLTMGGLAGLYVKPIDYVQLRSTFAFSYDSNHLISVPDKVFASSLYPAEPAYYREINAPGTRVMAESSLQYRWNVALDVHF